MTRDPSLRKRWRVLLAAYAFTSVPAWLAAIPIRATIGATLSGHAAGDALLSDPGAFWLIEVMRLNPRGLQAALSMMPWWVLGNAYLGLLTWTVVLVALVRGDLSGPWPLLAVAARRHRGVSVILALSLVLRIVVVVAGVLLVRVVAPAVASTGSERTQTIVPLIAGALVAVLVVLVRVPQDLAFAACVRHEEGGRDAWISGLAACRAHPFEALGAWGGRAMLGASLTVVALASSTWIGTASWSRLLCVGAIHQASLIALVVLRASWLRRALELIGEHASPRILDDGAEDDQSRYDDGDARA